MGNTPGWKTPTLLYGWWVAFMFDHWLDWLTLPLVAAFVLGESTGWGHNIGQVLRPETERGRPEKYQRWFPVLERHPWVGLAFRGFMWGFPMALLAYWDIRLLWLPAIFAIAFPAAIAIEKWAGHPPWPRWGEAWHEFYRGGLVGCGIWFVS